MTTSSCRHLKPVMMDEAGGAEEENEIRPGGTLSRRRS